MGKLLVPFVEAVIGGMSVPKGQIESLSMESTFEQKDEASVTILDLDCSFQGAASLGAPCSLSGGYLHGDKMSYSGVVKGVSADNGEDGVRKLTITVANEGAEKLVSDQKQETYNKMTAGEIAQKIGGEAGLGTSNVDMTLGERRETTTQAGETDAELLVKLAAQTGAKMSVQGNELYFRRYNPTAGANLTFGYYTSPFNVESVSLQLDKSQDASSLGGANLNDKSGDIVKSEQLTTPNPAGAKGNIEAARASASSAFSALAPMLGAGNLTGVSEIIDMVALGLLRSRIEETTRSLEWPTPPTTMQPPPTDIMMNVAKEVFAETGGR